MKLEHPARLGVQEVAADEWLAECPGDEVLLARRAELLGSCPDEVLAAMPPAYNGVEELYRTLSARAGHEGGETEPIEQLRALGHGVAEDICILTQEVEGGPFRFTAAVLCFPNRWRLTDKLGGTVLAIHDPVPEYAGVLSNGVDRFLDRMQPGRFYLRSNWGLVGSAELHIPEPGRALSLADERDPLHLRQEQQTFTRLPESGALIFSIRTHITPWPALAEEERARVLELVGKLSAQWLAYKGIVDCPA
jgi:dimethylamine monooxygenase subunit A